MGGENVEQLWFSLCLIKAVIILFVASVIVLLCKRFLRAIPRNRVQKRLAKQLMVHQLGRVQASRQAADLDSSDFKRRTG